MQVRAVMPSLTTSLSVGGQPHRGRAVRVLGAMLLLTGVLGLGGCRDDPAARMLQRLDKLVALLESNKESSDTLLAELEVFVDANRDAWGQDREAFEALGESGRTRLSAKYDTAMQTTLLHLMDVSAETQDRLRAEPAKLAKFLALLDQIDQIDVR